MQFVGEGWCGAVDICSGDRGRSSKIRGLHCYCCVVLLLVHGCFFAALLDFCKKSTPHGALNFFRGGFLGMGTIMHWIPTIFATLFMVAAWEHGRRRCWWGSQSTPARSQSPCPHPQASNSSVCCPDLEVAEVPLCCVYMFSCKGLSTGGGLSSNLSMTSLSQGCM